MNLFGVMDVSASALRAERVRAEVVASNMANAETTRTSASAADEECTVVSTRCPVSAAFSVRRMIAGSLNSPTIKTSGSSRSASTSACSKDGVSRPTCRWRISER